VRLTFLRPLYNDPGWFASVYVETSRATPDGGKQVVPRRWRDQREELERQGADAATLDALGETLTDPALSAPAAAAFGRSGSVAFTAKLATRPLRELARWAPLPDLMPLLVESPPRPPHLLVSANRAGGDILAVQTADDVTKESVEGTGWPIHRTRTGGWAQLEHQRATEEAWEHNAKELAAAVATVAGQVSPELVVVAGDVRARGLLVDKLPSDLKRRAVVVEHEVPVDSPELAEAAENALREAADDDCRARLETFRAQLGTGRACEGLAETVAALRDGQVAELFLGGDYQAGDRRAPALGWSDAPVWIGPELADLAVTEVDLRERGVSDLAQDRADAAVVRAVVGTDAEMFLVPGDEPAPAQDIGALLRYPVPLA
jgi:hypothetical protein